jgi:hypothetical protein
MDCVFIAGLLFVVGTDWNGDRYMINLDTVTNVVQDMSISDAQNDYRPRTMITTTNGTIVEDVDILDIAYSFSVCEQVYEEARAPQQQ